MKNLLVCFCLFLPVYGVAALCEMADKKLCDKAERGDVDAQYNLGVMYIRGGGVRQDIGQAKLWFEKAANQGLAGAQALLGVMYEDGEGVDQDYGKAKYWFEKAVAQGDTSAMLYLGGLYLNGHGVRQDYGKAKELYGQSCDNGSQFGCDSYRILNERGL